MYFLRYEKQEYVGSSLALNQKFFMLRKVDGRSADLPLGFFSALCYLPKSFSEIFLLFFFVVFCKSPLCKSPRGDLFDIFWSCGTDESFLNHCGKDLRFFSAKSRL